MKKTLPLIMALMMILSAFSVWAEGQKEGASGTGGLPMSGDGPSWTWDQSDWEFDWYHATTYSTWGEFYDPELNIVSKRIYEATGVKDINFTVAETRDNQRLTAMIAANDLPDVVQVATWHNQLTIMKEGELVHDLFELSEKYNAELKDQMLETPSVTNWHQHEDGSHYYLNAGNWPTERLQTTLGQRAIAKRGIDPKVVANQDYMEQLGIKPSDFGTQDGMFNALQKFADAGITYKDRKVWPLNIGVFNQPQDSVEYMARLMGLIYEDNDGNYQATWTNPVYLEMLKFLNKIYQAGFMPEEQFLWDTDRIQQNIVNGMYFCSMSNVGGSHNYYRQHFGDSGMWWAPVDPPKSEQGWGAALPTRDLDGSYHTFITKNAKEPGRLIRFFSFMHSPEGQFLAYWGEEGETFEWTDDGYCKLLPEVAKMEDDDVGKMIELWGIKHIFYTFRDMIVKEGYTPPPDRPAEKMTRDMANHYRKYQYSGDAIDALYPPSESEEAEIRTAIELYMDEQVMSMVLAKSEDELMDIYDESIARIKDMGLSKLNKWRNDEMWKRKNQLGVKFVSPRYLTK